MLRAGYYWVGDPCYILRPENGFTWHRLLDEHSFFGVDGEYTLTRAEGASIRIGILRTENGDGRFSDQDGNKYPVDVAMLSAVPLYGVPLKPLFKGGPVPPDLLPLHGLGKGFHVPGETDDHKLGAVHRFPKDFFIYNRDGVLVFGHVEIDTNKEAS